MSLAKQESIYLEKKIGRKPTSTEFQIVAAEWSEHCSYKSSKKHLKMLPMSGSNVISEKGYDSGVLDVGENYVVTVHIESHNHPSAVEPFGGAATGVGGVIRDILSAGTRPIAILDGLRFGDIEKDPHARWLFKNAVLGIADYGNCLGIPTIGGEIEFDNCYANYALVDVAAIGFGKKDKLIKNRAIKGDLVVLIGGPTGRDGIGGSQFASDSLESENRSAVQIPDPFIEKLIIEAILEARDQKCIKAMKDLGGGGLSCAVSETADSLGIGIELDVNQIHTRESNMKPDEIMVSESQERMLIITDKKKLNTLKIICKKFRIQCSVIGKVKTDSLMQVKKGTKILASLPTKIVANAPLIDRPSAIPKYLNKLQKEPFLKTPTNFSNILLKMISNPNIANKRWVYGQYDHEVGIRTVIKPGNDASVLR
ncbi:MAG: phosphoribosylformylglycinamidine synthase subunit PurL, partial [Nitrosopumilaceae archaeon]